MFELDRHLQQWKESLQQEGVFRAGDLEELESHLYEEMEALSAKGLTEEEAFSVACLRLGHLGHLAEEYAKVNAGLIFGRRLFWISTGFLALLFANFLAKGLSIFAVFVSALLGMRGYGLGVVAALFHLAVLILALWKIVAWIWKFYEQREFPRCLKSAWGKITLFMGLSILSLIILAIPLIFTATAARILTPQDFVKITEVKVYLFFLPIIGTLAPIALLIWLSTRIRKPTSSAS